MWRLCFRSNPPTAATVETIVEPLQPAPLAAEISPTDFLPVDKGLEATMKSSPSHYISRMLVVTICLNSIVFLGVLRDIRTEMQNVNQSAFKINGNGVFLIVSICALFTVEIMSLFMFSTSIPSKCYKLLKFIAIFSAYMAPWSLMLVLDDASKHNLMVRLLCCVIFAMALANVCSGDDDGDKNLKKWSPISIFAYIGLVMVPIALVLALCVPKNLDWVAYSLIYPTVGLEAICVLTIFFKLMFLHVIQQDESTNVFKAQLKNKIDLEEQKNIINS